VNWPIPDLQTHVLINTMMQSLSTTINVIQ